MQRVPIICAWCEAERKAKGLSPKLLGYAEIDVPPGHPPVSHGICTECRDRVFGETPKDEG